MTAKETHRRKILRLLGWGLLAILLAAVIVYLLIWYGPDMLARHDIGSITGPQQVPRLQQARDAARGRLLTLGAGLFAGGALIFTAQNYRVARRTLEVTEQGQVTDRYTRAIEQLGSTTVDVTIGGIYALERIARDSHRDHPAVMEVLAAYIREHSDKPLHQSTSGADTPERVTRPDIQAAITVIGRRDTANDRRRINLRGVHLLYADLAEAELSGADLEGANLTSADLNKAKLNNVVFDSATLQNANLRDTDLRDAHLLGAKLTDAILYDADLRGADLRGANLRGAHLRGAHLRDAHFVGAHFKDAHLGGAHLRGAHLAGANFHGMRLHRVDFDGADLNGAYWPEESPAPEGWIRDSASGRLQPRSTGTGDTGN